MDTGVLDSVSVRFFPVFVFVLLIRGIHQTGRVIRPAAVRPEADKENQSFPDGVLSIAGDEAFDRP